MGGDGLMDRLWLFERGAFDQDYVDFLILAGSVPVYRDPDHPRDKATLRNPGLPRRMSVWAHPSMPLNEIRYAAGLIAWDSM
jgi:hypothetical protein